MKVFTNFLLFLPLLFSAALLAAEDCPMGKLEVNGKVMSANKPVADARVEVHWDETRAANLSANTSSAADGSFRLAFSFETVAGRSLLGKIKCGYQPARVQLRVEHPSFAGVQRDLATKKLLQAVVIELKPKAR